MINMFSQIERSVDWTITYLQSVLLIMAEQNTFSLLFFAIKNRVNEKGEIPLHMRITVNKQKVELALHRRVDISIWSPGMGMATGNTKEAKSINNFLMSVQTSIYDIYKYLRETGKPVTPTAIKNAYLGIGEDKGKKLFLITPFAMAHR